MNETPMYYNDYLQLNKLLESQHPLSFQNNNIPAHDEMLFIIIHQAYELWFKQILFELDYVTKVFLKEKINDNSEDLNLVNHRLNRIIRIINLLNQQVEILDTMTPLDFLEFRNLLSPASGFQSVQFRLIEARLGLDMKRRHQSDYYKRTSTGGFSQNDYNRLSKIEEEKTVRHLMNEWLERMPFFEHSFWTTYQSDAPVSFITHPFWNDYRNIYQKSLTEKESGKVHDFDYVFFNKPGVEFSEEQKELLRSSFSAEAMRAALFIMLYRDFPVFQTSYQILDALVEIDHALSNWRHKHFIMVRRMIGLRVGTGNTSGSGYLEGALNRHYIFKDLAGLSTFLIERRNLPRLPEELTRHLSFNIY